MPIAQKEFVLNNAMNRWKLNSKNNVGPISDSIRNCNPSSLKEWEEYYYAKVQTSQHLDSLGEKLYQHIVDDLPGEKRFHPDLLSSITEEDCIAYMHTVVITRTYNGFMKERGLM